MLIPTEKYPMSSSNDFSLWSKVLLNMNFPGPYVGGWRAGRKELLPSWHILHKGEEQLQSLGLREHRACYHCAPLERHMAPKRWGRSQRYGPTPSISERAAPYWGTMSPWALTGSAATSHPRCGVGPYHHNKPWDTRQEFWGIWWATARPNLFSFKCPPCTQITKENIIIKKVCFILFYIRIFCDSDMLRRLIATENLN